MQDRNIIPILLDIYGALLSERQRDVLDLYYNDDLSLSEISENLGITRQGVRDAIKRGTDLLVGYERCLALYKKSLVIKTETNNILRLSTDQRVIDSVKRILESEE